MAYSNPYDSARVLRALVEDLLEEVYTHVYMLPSYEAEIVARDIVYGRLKVVGYRGTPLDRYFTLDPIVEGNTLTFRFRKLNDDGEWLLRRMELTKAESPSPQVPKEYAKKMSVKRVVDL